MIKGREWQTLKGQLVLTAVMFGGCLAAAIFMATRITWAEKYIREKYKLDDLTEEVRGLIADAENETLNRQDYLKLNAESRGQLYEDWMNRADQPLIGTARTLLRVDADYYLRRAEQTVVCGSQAQRSRALGLIVMAAPEAARQTLRRLSTWSQRRNLGDLTEAIRTALREVPSRPADGRPPLPIP